MSATLKCNLYERFQGYRLWSLFEMPPCGPLALSISPDLDRAIFYNFTNNFIDKLEVGIALVPGRRSILLS